MVYLVNAYRFLEWTTLVGVLLMASGTLVHAESPGVIAGLKPILPVVPTRQTRQAEGMDERDKWQFAAPEKPMASFIESLKSNDAALQVVVGQGRLLTLKQDLAGPDGTSVIAVGDPTIVDFEVLPNPRMIRLIGLRTGVTDLSFVLANGDSYSFEVHIVYDLPLLQAHLKQMFPSADLRIAQLREHLVLEGQARSPQQVAQILSAVRWYLGSVQVARSASADEVALPRQERGRAAGAEGEEDAAEAGEEGAPRQESEGEAAGGRPDVNATIPAPQIINLIQVPGSHQVLLKVRIAELNRTAMREVGADLAAMTNNGTLLGTQIGGASVTALASLVGGGVSGSGAQATSPSSTAFGVFPTGDFDVILRFLRTNDLAKLLAEPNLVTMSGQRASFLAGGEFPVPVPSSAAVGTTIQFKQFGVQLDFLPFVLDEERIRLSVTPEVSNLDFTIGTSINEGSSPVPGLRSRRTSTTVELQEGQTLAVAGLMLTDTGGDTSRIPGLGDLPYIGQLFSNTAHRRIESEMLVMVTPYLVEPLDHGQHGPLPGEDILDPNDEEFFFMNRIEGRTGRPFRSTTEYEFFDKIPVDRGPAQFHGPVGFSNE